MPLKKIIFCALFLCFAFTTSVVLANKNLTKGYLSRTGAFQVAIADEYRETHQDFRITSDMVLSAEQIVSTVDQRPFINNVKRYIVQLEQTLGPALSQSDYNRLIDIELDGYIAHYAKNNAVLKNREKKYFGRSPGGEIYMVYNDEDMGEQALRARVLYSDRSKVLQIITSANEHAFSTSSEEFFDSLSMKNGILENRGNIIDDWKEYVSPMNLISVLLPQPAPPYIKDEPKIERLENSEQIQQIFYDPVRRENIYYKIAGYRAAEFLNPQTAQRILAKQHASKYSTASRDLQFVRSKSPEGFTVIDATFAKQGDKKGDALNIIKLRATFFQNLIMVQEVVAPQALMSSRFVSNLLAHTIFHPQDFNAESVRSE